MKEEVIVTFFMLILFVGVPIFLTSIGGEEGQVMQKESIGQRLNPVTISVIYDNNPYKQDLEAAWGFSCLVEGPEKTILFDTGGNGSILMRNMEKLEIRPDEIDLVVLSHIHGDHVGGLSAFLAKNPEVSLYIPTSFPIRFKQHVKRYGPTMVEVRDSVKICEHVYSTGELGGGIKEQSLIIQTDKGLIIITGCAHPGIVKIVQKAKTVLKDEVLFVMGGFHLGGESESRLEGIVSDFRKLGVQYVGPCHCSGDTARQVFQKEYQNKFIPVGVGTVITLEDLP
jgi:7,8-dihydropterin-6-yl-methyl-4-(beta-D-ribofuranosyl)aminobenzene 5'-phosphate synthase